MNFRRLMSCGLAVMLVLLTIAGCGSDNGAKQGKEEQTRGGQEDGSGKLDPVTLKIMIPGDRPADMDKVLREAEKRMADTLNVKLNVVFVPFSDLGQKTQMTLASGEEIDLIFDAPWLHVNQMISAGFYEPVEDLLKQYGPNIMNSRPEEMWESNKFDGKIYGIPLGSSHAMGTTYLVRKDIREKLGVPPIQTYDELIKFAYTVKEKEPNIVPFLPIGQDSQKYMSEASFRMHFDYDTKIQKTHALGSTIVLYYKNNDGKVYNLFEEMEPKVWDWILNARKLYNDNIIHPDVLAIKDTDEEFRSGKIAIHNTNDFGVKDKDKQAIAQNVSGGEVEAVTFFDMTPKKNISNFKQWNFLFVPAVSKHKERAIQFLNWTQEKENYDLLAYGIQGENWEPVGEDQYKMLNDKYTWFPYAWIWNPIHDRLNASDPEEVIELNKFLRKADHFEKDILTGFEFVSEPVANEIAKYNTIEAKYFTAIFNGVVDPDEYWAKFKEEAAPTLKIIQDELQKQIDAFLAKR